MPHQQPLLPASPAWLPQALGAFVRHEYLTAAQLALVCALPREEAVRGLDEALGARLLIRVGTSEAFALSRRGAVLAREMTGEPGIRAPHARRAEYLIDHELARNDLAAVLVALDRQGLLRLVRFETARSKLADVARVVLRGRPIRVPLVADALAIVEGEGEPTALLVEVDRGTVSTARMRLKYAGYLAWWREQDGPRQRFGLKSLRVLTLVPTSARLERLREAAREADRRGSGLLWFGLQGLVSLVDPARLFAPEWLSASEIATPTHLVLPRPAAEAGV